jgi:hypothetical protein
LHGFGEAGVHETRDPWQMVASFLAETAPLFTPPGEAKAKAADAAAGDGG